MKVFNDCGEVVLHGYWSFGNDTDLGSIRVVNGGCYSTDTSQYINLSFNGNSYHWPSSKLKNISGRFAYNDNGRGPNPPYTSPYIEGLVFGGNLPGQLSNLHLTQVNSTDITRLVACPTTQPIIIQLPQ
jgi:hypothetical protein